MDRAVHTLARELGALPDYAGNSIVNLMSSLIAGLGGEAPHPSCTALDPADAARFRNVVLLVIDGLGYEFLQQQTTNVIAQAHPARLTSVFPSTTASAITSYLTGLTPRQHGLTGWFTFLRELGSVAAILPFKPRHGGPTYREMGVNAKNVFSWPSVFERLDVQSIIVTPQHIADSDYSRATAGPAVRLPYRDLEGYFATIQAALRMPAERRYVYAYWPQLDSLCHRHGTCSDEVRNHFQALCRGLQALLDSLEQRDTLVLVCADHGHIDTSTQRTVDLQDHPELSRCMALPLCGEPRAAFCYVHGDSSARFEHYVENELEQQCLLIPRAQLLQSAWLGEGKNHPELSHRVGDYLLLMRDNWIIRDRLAGEEHLVQVGVHGGLSSEEVYVPLARFER